MTRALVIALTLGSSALQAQQPHPLVGAWQISFTAGMRVENGMSMAIPGTASLTIEAQGDSLIGTLVADSIPDLPRRPPSRLAGRVSDGAVTLISHSTATLNMGGMERSAAVVNSWVLTAKGDSLEGTLQRSIEGLDDAGQEPRPVTGSRRKA